MWFAQQRVWEMFPPSGDLLRMLAAVHYKSLQKRMRRRPKNAPAEPPIDKAKLYAPLSNQELAVLGAPQRRAKG